VADNACSDSYAVNVNVQNTTTNTVEPFQDLTYKDHAGRNVCNDSHN